MGICCVDNLSILVTINRVVCILQRVRIYHCLRTKSWVHVSISISIVIINGVVIDHVVLVLTLHFKNFTQVNDTVDKREEGGSAVGVQVGHEHRRR